MAAPYSYEPNKFLPGELALYDGNLYEVDSASSDGLTNLWLLSNRDKLHRIATKALVSPHRLLYSRSAKCHIVYYQGKSDFIGQSDFTESTREGAVRVYDHNHLFGALPFDQGDLVLCHHFPDTLFLVTKLLRKQGEEKGSPKCDYELTRIFGRECNKMRAFGGLQRLDTFTVLTRQGGQDPQEENAVSEHLHQYSDVRYLSRGRALGHAMIEYRGRVAELDLYHADTEVTDFASAAGEVYGAGGSVQEASTFKSGDDQHSHPLSHVVRDDSTEEASLTPAVSDPAPAKNGKFGPSRDLFGFQVPSQEEAARLSRHDAVRWQNPEGLWIKGRFTQAGERVAMCMTLDPDTGRAHRAQEVPYPVYALVGEEVRRCERMAYLWYLWLADALQGLQQTGLIGKGPMKELRHQKALQNLDVRLMRGTSRVPGCYDFSLFASPDSATPVVEVCFYNKSQTQPPKVRIHSYKEYDFQLTENPDQHVVAPAAKQIAKEFVKNISNPNARRSTAVTPRSDPPARHRSFEQVNGISRPKPSNAPLSDEEWEHAQRELDYSTSGSVDLISRLGGRNAVSREREELGDLMDMVNRNRGKLTCYRSNYNAAKSDYSVSVHGLKMSAERTKEFLAMVKRFVEPEPLRTVVADANEEIYA